MPREEVGWWGDVTIDGKKYPLAAPCVPQALPDVVPAFRTGAAALEHRIGARWWEGSDFSLGIGGEDLDVYQNKHHLAWAENIDASEGGAMTLGYRITDDSSAAASYATPPEVATPAAFSSVGGSRLLYAVFGNTVYKRTSGGVWSSIGTMTNTTQGRTVVETYALDYPPTLIFVGWASASDPIIYKTTNGTSISALTMYGGSPVRGVAATVVPVYRVEGAFDCLHVSSLDGTLKGYSITTVAALVTIPIKLPGPVLFLAPRFANYLTSGFWGLVDGELWNLVGAPHSEYAGFALRVCWGKHLTGGCMHGPLACVFSGLRMWLVDEGGRSQDISPFIEELVGFASGAGLSFTAATSDGQRIYATVKYQNREWLWAYDGQGWQSVGGATLGSPTSEATLGLLAEGYDSSDRALYWLYSWRGTTDSVRCRRFELPQGLRQSGRDKTSDSGVGKILLPWFTGGSPESGTLYKHWLEHTVPSGAQIAVTKRTNYGAYDNSDLSPNTISGQATAERKTTFITCGGNSGLPFSSVQFQYTLLASSTGLMPRIHRIGFEWYKATRITAYPVSIDLHTVSRTQWQTLLSTLLAMGLDTLHTLSVPYVVNNACVRLVSIDPTPSPDVVTLQFQTV